MYGAENETTAARPGVATMPPVPMSHRPCSSAVAKSVAEVGTSCNRTCRSLASWWAISMSSPTSSRLRLTKAYGGRSSR